VKKDEHVMCNLCQVDDARLIFEAGEFRIVQCNRCSLFYVNPRPSSEEAKEIYSEDYWTGESEYGFKRGYIRHLKAGERAFRRYLKHISYYKGSGRFLDIGCGVGLLLKVASEVGYETYGLEVSEFASNFARDNYGLNVSNGTLDEVKFPGQYFGIVTMFNVFSHLPDPLGYFLEVHRIVEESGIFTFTTGNYSLLPDSLFKERWGQPEEHFWKLNDQSVDVLLARTGFRLIRSQKLGYIIPVSPRKLSQIGIPDRVLSFLLRVPKRVLTDEVMYICRKGNEPKSS